MDIGVPSYQGSGLPTIQMQPYDVTGDSAPIHVAYLSFHNVLTEPVPSNITDLRITQDILLLDKRCVKSIGTPSFFLHDALPALRRDEYNWTKLAETLPQHDMPWREVEKTPLNYDDFNYTVR